MDKKTFQSMIDRISKDPCADCGAPAEAVASFIPKDPDAFGARPGDAVYFPICRKCLQTLDPEWMESVLLNAGIQTRPETSLKTRG